MPEFDDPYFTPAPSPRPSRRRSPENYDPLIEKHAADNQIDPNLIRAVMNQESRFNPTAVSPKNAQGLMQLIPATAARFGTKNVFDPDENIRGGARYLKFLSDRYKGDLDKVLAGYNAGEGAVDKYRGVPPYKETRSYVPAVKARYQKLTGGQLPQTPQSDPYFTPEVQTPKQPAIQADPYFTPDGASQLPTGRFGAPDTTAGSRKGLPKTPNVTSEVRDFEPEKLAPIKFQPADLSEETNLVTRTATGVAENARMQGMDLPKTHPNLMGQRVTVKFDHPPTAEEVDNALLEQLGKGYGEVGAKFRAEMGTPLTAQNVAIEKQPDGSYLAHARTSQGFVDALNAYAQGGRSAYENVLTSQQMGKAAVARDVNAELKKGEGIRQDLGQAGAREVGRNAQFLQNLGNLVQGKAPEDDPNARAISAATRSIPTQTTNTGALAEIPLSAAGAITRAEALGGTAGFPASAAIESAEQGPEAAYRAGIMTAPMLAAGPIAESIGANAMSPIGRQVASRGIAGAAMAAPAVASGASPKEVGQAFLEGAAFPVGKRGEVERPTELDIERAPVSGVQGRGALDADRILAEREARIRPSTIQAEEANARPTKVSESVGRVPTETPIVTEGTTPAVAERAPELAQPTTKTVVERPDGWKIEQVTVPFVSKKGVAKDLTHYRIIAPDNKPIPSGESASLAEAQSQLNDIPSTEQVPDVVQTTEAPQVTPAQEEIIRPPMKSAESPVNPARAVETSPAATPSVEGETVAKEPSETVVSTIVSDVKQSPARWDLEKDGHGGVRGGGESQTERAYRENPQEVYDSFQSTRDALRAEYGETVPMWRADSRSASGKPLTRWAIEKRIAEGFAEGRELKFRQVPVDDVVAAFATESGPYAEFYIKESGARNDVIGRSEKANMPGAGVQSGGGGTAAQISEAVKPIVKKSQDFGMDGIWEVTLPDGSKHRMFRDPEDTNWYDADVRDATKNPEPHTGLLSTLNKADAIKQLASKSSEPSTPPTVAAPKPKGAPTEVAEPKVETKIQEARIQARIKAEIPDHAPKGIRAAKERLIRREESPVETKPLGKQAGAAKLPQEEFDRLLSRGWDFYDQKVKPTFNEWSRKLREEFGPSVNQHLQRVWNELTTAGDIEPSITSAKKAQVDIDRAERGAESLPWSPKTKSDTELLESAQEANAKNPDEARRLVDEVLTKPRALSDKETVQVDIRKQELSNQYNQLLKDVADAEGDDLTAKRAQVEAIEKEFDDTERAWRASGTEKGRGLRSQQVTINQDFELLPMLNRYKVKTGKDPTPEIRAQIENQHKRISQLEKDLAKAQESGAAKAARAAVEKIQREVRRGERQVTRKVLDDEAAVIKSNIAAEFARLRSQAGKGTSLSQQGLGLLDPEGVITKELSKFVRNRVKAGVTDVAQIVDDAHGMIKEFAGDVTRRQIEEAISGYGKPVEKRSELEQQIATLRSQMKSELRQADVEAGQITEKRQGPPTPPKQGPKAVKDAIQRRYQKQIDEINERIRTQGYAPKSQRGPTVLDADTQKIKVNLERAKQDFQRKLREWEYSQRSKSEKVADLAVNWSRAAKLMYTSTLGKLGSAATGRIVMSPIENMVGEIPHRLMPKLSAKAPTEGGGFSKAAEVAALWKSGRFRQVLDYLTKGSSDLDVLLGNRKSMDKEMNSGGLLGIPGRVHGAMKEYPRQAEFDRAFVKVLKNYERSGKDITQPDVQLAAKMEAFNSADRARFQQRNFISDTFNSAMGTLERKGIAGKAAAKAGRFIFPITRVPVNVVGETLNYTFGIPRAVVETAIRGGVKNLTPEQADNIMRAYKKGGVGLAVMTYAFLHPNQFGGYYQKGDKRDEKEPQFGEIMFFGKRIPKVFTHVPILEAAQFAATARRVMDKMIEKGDEGGKTGAIAEGGLAATKGLAEEVPFYETPARWFTGKEGSRGVAEGAGELARGTIPGFIQETAKYTDKDAQGNPIPRAPQGGFPSRFGQTIEMGVPGLRQRVPVNEDLKQKRLKLQATDDYRSGKITKDDLDEKVSNGELTEADVKRITKQGEMTPRQVTFSNARATDAIDRFERMNPTQQEELRDIMKRHAWTLTHSDTLTDAQKETYKQRLEGLGIEPVNPQKKKSGGWKSAFKSKFVAP